MIRRSKLAALTFGAIFLAGCASAPAQAPETVAQAPSATAAPVEIGPTPVAMGTESPEPAVAGGEVTFRIVPEESEARFLIDEILAGSPKVVVGTTSTVSGEITGEFAEPQAVRVGLVTVDMSTLRTDNSFRNRALHDAILQTGAEANRFATFSIASIEGLPSEVEFGATYEVALSGDLTIHGTTRSVTFKGSVTPAAPDRIEGSASASMPYADFGIQILRLPPQVASVGDIVTLEIDFVAVRE